MHRILSVSCLTLPLLALVAVPRLCAQTINVDQTSLTFFAQFGGAAVSQTITVTASNGLALPFTLSTPSYPWIKFNGQALGFQGTTPAQVTVSADPSGLTAGTHTGSIAVLGGISSNNPIGVTFNVGAIGVTPDSLAFTYTAGSSSFPASQSLTLSGSSQCTATADMTSGGSWFTLTPSTCFSPGVLTVLINTAVVAGLAANTYHGTITITPSPAQGQAIVVPVTLTVLSTPQVTVSPASLVFNWQTGTAAANPSQTFNIYTSGSQPMGFSFSPPVVDTGAWISTIAPPSGTISPTTGTQITVTVNPSGLPVGTYTGKLTLLTSGGTPAHQDIPVKLNVSNTPLLNVPTATLNFTTQVNVTPPAQTVNITSTGTALNYSVGPITYTPSANSGWLSVPNAGSTGAPLPVSVNPAGLTAGTYSATINVVSATPGSTAQQIPVVLKVTNEPVISASVSALSFPYQIGQAVPPGRTVKITSSTTAPLNYSASVATTSCGSAWLLLNGGTSTINAVTPTNDTLTVSVAIAGLTAATCSGTVTINATNPATGAAAIGSPITIGVTLYVSTGAQLVLTPPDPAVFTVGVGGQSPASKTITLSSTNSDVLNYNVTFQPSGTWLLVNTQSGSTIANNSLTLSVNPAGLSAGTYGGSVTIAATNTTTGAAVADSPVTVPVTLNVTSGALTLSPASLSFEQTSGGPAPSAQTVTIGSSGQALNYTAVVNVSGAVNWLSVSPGSGNTSTTGTLTVSVDGSRLTAGVTYTGTIVVTSPLAGNSPATINVSFKVDPGTISAPTTTLTFTRAAGGAAPPAQSIAVTGTPGPLNFTASATTVNGVAWLGVTPASGTTPSSVQVSVNGAALAVAQYTGTVTITSAGANGSPIRIGVILNVVPPAALAASPTSLSFTSAIGQAPPSQNLSISAAGGATVPFTVQTQVDGIVSQWLAASPTSGSTPATVSISASPVSLASGTYTGRVIISSSNASAIVTVGVTLTVSTIPKPVVTAVTNAASYAPGALSPGENIVFFGTGLGPTDLVKATVANNVFPTRVGNTRVLFDNVAAPVIYASTGQTSVMVPYEIYGRTTTSVVVEYSGVQSAPLTYNVTLAAPGIYTMNQQGTGPGAILNQDGVTVNSASAPEKRGNVIAVYMTGEGQTSPQGVDGAIIAPVASALKQPILKVTAKIGGVDAVVQYAGSAPSLVSGVMQVNVTIPLNAPTGSAVPVVISVGTVPTQSGASAATVAIQ